MLVEAELIEQAKERLGDSNFEFIMKFLGVEDYDEVHMKCCCPVHDEKTPSMVYDRKRFRCHCFGCGATFDFVDAYTKGTGGTFLEAAEVLFKEAEVQYVFGERGIKTKREYRYPKEESKDNDMTPVYTYLESRGISRTAAEYADIRADRFGNIVFNYYDFNDVLTNVKYRPSHKVEKGSGENKMWAQKDADTTPLLFCANKANYSQPLLITEGEMDTLAAFTAGYQNAVSVPFGCQNFTWVDENWAFLEKFNMIIICSDNDEPGLKMRHELIARLGTWRTKYVDIPAEMVNAKTGNTVRVKDLNEVLYYGGAEEAMNLILNAREAPLESVTDISDIGDVELEDLEGLTTGITELDKVLMKLFFGTLTVISGQPGAGKSSFLTQLMIQALEEDYPVWMFSRENPAWMQRLWVNHILAGRRGLVRRLKNDGTEYYHVRPEVKEAISNRYRGLWYLHNDEASNKLEDIMQTMTDMVRRRGVKVLILDNLMTIDLECNEANLLQKQTECITRLVKFAITYDVAVILVAHPRKLAPGTQFGLQDVAGNSTIGNLCHRMLALRRVTEAEKQGRVNRWTGEYDESPNKFDVEITVVKDRLSGRVGKTVGMYYDAPSRRFFSNPEEYVRQYSYDRNTYTDQLEYPIKDLAEEAFR